MRFPAVITSAFKFTTDSWGVSDAAESCQIEKKEIFFFMAWNLIFNEILPLAWCVVCRRRETLASSWWCRCCCFSVEIIDRSIRHPTTTVLPHLWAVTLEDDDLERDWGMALLFFAQMKVRGRLFSLSSPLWLDYPSASQCTNSDLKKLSPPLALRTWPYRPLQYRFLPPFWIFLFLFLFVRSIWSSIFWLKNQYRIKGECKYPLFLPVYFHRPIPRWWRTIPPL